MTTQPKKERKAIIPEKWQDLAAVATMMIIILIFLGKAIFGNGFNASDNIASESFQPYLQEAAKKSEFPQWLPYIFSGIPSYAALLTTGNRTWDFSGYVVNKISYIFASLLGNDTARISFWYMVYGIGMYYLMRVKKHERMTALFTAIAAVFSTWVMTWIMIGHNTKPIALSMFPYILLCLESIREKFSLKYAVLLVIAVHVMVESTHLQMVFYGVCTFGLYLIFELISRLITKKQPMGVVRGALVLAVAGALSFAMGADRFLSTIEYTPFSTRGSAPISQINASDTTKKSAANKQDVNGGNDYEYATNWSFSPEEMMTFLVPNYYGFGKLKYKGPLTGGRESQIPTYFGQMPFTDAANYMGIGVLFLGIFGAWKYRRDVFVQFLITLSLFSLLLSFGKNLSVVYDLFFNYVPMFNKFRTPSMALAMMQFAFPVLAAYGIAAFASLREEKVVKARRAGMYMAVACAAFFLLGLVYPSINETTYRNTVEISDNSNHIKSYEADVKSGLSEFIYSEMKSDWLATGFIALLIGVLIWMFVQKKISPTLFYPALMLLALIDLWRVDVRPMDIPKSKIESSAFAKTDLISFLQTDSSTFRIADLDVLPAPNVAAFFKLENIHGYHSAKMRVYQDLLDEAGNGGGSIINNPVLWNLLNVKYILSSREVFPGLPATFTSRQTRGMVYTNPGFLPRAFFVKRAVVESKTNILAHLKNNDFNPVETAFVEEPLKEPIDSVTGEAGVNLTERRNEYMKFDVNATGNNLLYVSEVYYPVSWKAYIDGNETTIYKTDFAFRSVIVPKGKHTLEFKYSSPKFEQGKTLSLAANILLLLGAVGAVFIEWKSKKANTASAEV